VKSCDKYKCKAVESRILLRGIIVPCFEPVSVGAILYWIGEEECEDIFVAIDVITCNTNKNAVSQ